MFVTFAEMKSLIKKALLAAGLNEEQAEICAQVHTESSRDGIESHGLNRVPRFIDSVHNGWVNLNSELELVDQFGVIERYDGNLGIGIINAKKATNRAIELAKQNGVGIVALRNTNHWMRGGTYMWDLVEQGLMGISWTNTESCMPAWGSAEKNVGNNPFCMGIPREAGPVVLDMAMSQFAWGKLQVTQLAGEQLPIPGGFDSEGQLTTDPGQINESGRILPTGYWKGSSLAILLDLFATVLADGNSTAKMDRLSEGSCVGCTQIFMAFDPKRFISEQEMERIIEETITGIKNVQPAQEGKEIRYPGEGQMANRKRSQTEGIHADESVWEEVKKRAEA
ncbi:3-dehydro-L-gulonate 2-dehydrogenase [Bacillus sp. B15-48]|uniref:3-dehydro-L-gulonate 2-dehydrogenase n=1 Tax=Bacillus sp. B15-48 TaxID=1548601 RepID=UPI00193ED5DE|nr:3-dehydro-L-gulonate 2-dehydrogenase [Bacillus sp. B15-48]MBM4761187.1 3-dehydro-L-gulonate 2-dehydrogenase [Bacillus sp. B15-48]